MTVSLTLEKARAEFQRLNERFSEQQELIGDDSAALYKFLESKGVIIRDSVLVRLFPDDGRQWAGTVVRHDGIVCDFCLDLNDNTCNEFVSGAKINELKTNGRNPWDEEVLAKELFSKPFSRR